MNVTAPAGSRVLDLFSCSGGTAFLTARQEVFV